MFFKIQVDVMKGSVLHQKQLTRKITHDPSNFIVEKTHPDLAVHKVATGERLHSPGAKSQKTAQDRNSPIITLLTEGVTAYKRCGTQGKNTLEFYACCTYFGEEPKAGKGEDQEDQGAERLWDKNIKMVR